MKTIELKTDLLLGLFVGSLILANVLGTKITTLFGVRVSVGIFFIPVLFLVTDIICEVHGKKKAKAFVYIALFVMIITLVMTYFSIILPPNATWGNQEAFAIIFNSSLRISFASIIAFIFSQFHDVWAFHYWKKLTKGKYLWLRNNASTIVSQLIDTTIFMFIAFYNINPGFDAGFIISLIIPYWLLKIGFALADTPFVYLGTMWLRKE
ncbi:MAG: queuosine precursor transporter [Candidatus Woesearchaeota archaeon]